MRDLAMIFVAMCLQRESLYFNHKRKEVAARAQANSENVLVHNHLLRR